MSVPSCDKFALQYIEQEIIAEDRKLMETKWWDYRVMHPTHATLYFYRLYNQIAAEFISKYVSNKDGDHYKRFCAKMDLRTKSKATIRAFWKARQAADACGVPYAVYIRTTLENFYGAYHKFATTKGGKQKLPYPTQLTSAIIVEAVMREWDAVKQVRPQFPEHEMVLNNPNLWFRVEMEAEIIAAIESSEYPKSYMRDALGTGVLLGPA